MNASAERTTEKLPHGVLRVVRVDEIDSVEDDVRSDTRDVSVDELGETMKDFGPLQNLVVTHDPKTRRYRVIAGERRFRAAKHAKLPTIPALILDDVDDRKALVLKLVENMQRTDLSAFEQAQGMAELRNRFGYSHQKIADTLGKSMALVRERFALLKVPEPIRRHVERGELGIGAAIDIAQAKVSEEEKIAIAKAAVEKRLPEDIVKRVVDEIGRVTKPEAPPVKSRKVEKPGAPLSRDEMTAVVRNISILGDDKLLGSLQRLQLHRWDAAGKDELRDVIRGIEESLRQFRERFLRQKQ